jgi:DNA-binding transcriptional MerR regulator
VFAKAGEFGIKIAMKPSEVAKILGMAATTIRAWSQEFGDFLSPTGAGGEGRHRDFSDLDVRILAFVQEQKRAGRPGYEIRFALQQLQAIDWEGLPYVSERPNFAKVPVIPEAAAHAALDAERRSLLREIVFLQEQNNNLQVRLEAKDAVLEQKTAQILELTRRLSEVDTELKFYREGRLKPSK